jgi:hypothetical protein
MYGCPGEQRTEKYMFSMKQKIFFVCSTNISKIKGYTTNSCDFFKVDVFLLAAAIVITRHRSQKPAYATD